ncbi:MAG TPA: N-6 DNA methylase [Conexibacter sp.]|nr:N-6 DNA methylase [Conexibacter sp.]
MFASSNPVTAPHRLRRGAALPLRQLAFAMEANFALSPEEEATGEHGEVFTRRWVVELILDLVGYTPDRDLTRVRALEPACGSGAFLAPMIERLIASAARNERSASDLADCIRAFDLLSGNVAASRRKARDLLTDRNVDDVTASRLSEAWVEQRDFLLSPPEDRTFDVVVGNPPYIRLEAVPRERSDAYRRACATMGGRADVYVGFYEQGVHALRDGGALAFICADRWMRNAYGAKLRELVTSNWSVEAIVSMTGVDAFEEEVDAYPAITLIRRGAQIGGPIVVEGTPELDDEGAHGIREFAAGGEEHGRGRGFRAARLHGWFEGQAAWPKGSPDQLALLADLEAAFPTLEDSATGTRVGIGVATGADKVFIVRDPEAVEPERLLPLAKPRDIATGEVIWSGSYLVNPWDADGLIALGAWPRVAAYLGAHEAALRRRHTAKNGRWHKTIDRVIEGLVERPKLYLPDFKEAMFPVLDDGRTYPHHNLYWVTSDAWDLRVLGGLLLSDVANLFIEAYSVRMRGGFLRFQAQYLRRIRLPRLADVDASAQAALATAFAARDRSAATVAALPLYGLERLPS